MNAELDAALVKDFPGLYRNRHGDMRTTAMCWGFDVGDGWHNIIRELSEAITHATGKAWSGAAAKSPDHYFQCGFDVVAVQVKEKFGGLRFYYHTEPKPGVSEEMIDGDYAKEVSGRVYGMVDLAEHLSYVTCESCGSPGEINDGGWLSVRCGVCRRADG